MSQPNYSDLESGKTMLKREDAEKLGEYYEVSPKVFLLEESPIINHNTGEHSKSINNTEQYFEAGREMLLPILERIDKILIMVLEEKKQLVSERKLLLEIFDKLASKLNDR